MCREIDFWGRVQQLKAIEDGQGGKTGGEEGRRG